MFELEQVYKYILDYFYSRFDFSLLTKSNHTFIGLTYIKRTPGVPTEISSVHFFPIKPNPLEPSNKSNIDLLEESNVLATTYLKNCNNKVEPYKNSSGYASSLVINERDILVITIICHPDNYVFLYNSIKNQLNILVTKP